MSQHPPSSCQWIDKKVDNFHRKPGNHRFSHEIVMDFPVIFPLSQSIDPIHNQLNHYFPMVFPWFSIGERLHGPSSLHHWPGSQLRRAREGERRQLPAAADRQVGARHPLLGAGNGSGWKKWFIYIGYIWFIYGLYM